MVNICHTFTNVHIISDWKTTFTHTLSVIEYTIRSQVTVEM